MRLRGPLLAQVLPVLLAGVCAQSAVLAENVNPLADGSQFAYGENVGWINAQPLGPGGPGLEVNDFNLTGWLWGENVGWISLSCENTASCGTVDYGVANDGNGVLSGYAWGENTGWINFAPATAGVAIDPATGDFSGRAWGENIGWITFASAAPFPYKIQTGWCSGTPAPPSGSPTLTLAEVGSGSELSWSSLAGAGWFDVVRGDLAILGSSGGDFTAATAGCLADNTTAASLVFSGTPGVGAGYWFLVRGDNCKGRGNYDSGAPSQVGSRDAEINAAPGACP